MGSLMAMLQSGSTFRPAGEHESGRGEAMNVDEGEGDVALR